MQKSVQNYTKANVQRQGFNTLAAKISAGKSVVYIKSGGKRQG
jgi:hypothetical protein